MHHLLVTNVKHKDLCESSSGIKKSKATPQCAIIPASTSIFPTWSKSPLAPFQHSSTPFNMPFKTSTLQLLSLLFSCAIAVPTPQDVFALPDCSDTYNVTNQYTFEGQFISGDYTVSGGSTLTDGSTYSVGVTVTIGADLSLSQIAGLDLSATISTTTTKATSQGASVPCPEGPWKCALAIYPEFLQVSGTEIFSGNTECYRNSKVPPSSPYTVSFPVEGDSGGVKSRVDICACQNFAHWADQGAPSIVCESCA